MSVLKIWSFITNFYKKNNTILLGKFKVGYLGIEIKKIYF